MPLQIPLFPLNRLLNTKFAPWISSPSQIDITSPDPTPTCQAVTSFPQPEPIPLFVIALLLPIALIIPPKIPQKSVVYALLYIPISIIVLNQASVLEIRIFVICSAFVGILLAAMLDSANHVAMFYEREYKASLDRQQLEIQETAVILADLRKEIEREDAEKAKIYEELIQLRSSRNPERAARVDDVEDDDEEDKRQGKSPRKIEWKESEVVLPQEQKDGPSEEASGQN